MTILKITTKFYTRIEESHEKVKTKISLENLFIL